MVITSSGGRSPTKSRLVNRGPDCGRPLLHLLRQRGAAGVAVRGRQRLDRIGDLWVVVPIGSFPDRQHSQQEAGSRQAQAAAQAGRGV